MGVVVSHARKNLFGVTAAFLFAGLGAATPALARGLVADTNPTTAFAACSLGDASCSPLNLDGNNIFVYQEGIISIGTALNPTAIPSDLSTISVPFIAPALAAYSIPGGVTVSDAFFNTPDPTLRIAWVFKNPGTYDTVFDIDLSANTANPTALYGFVHYGYSQELGLDNNLPAGCGTCASDFSKSDVIVGDTLLLGTLIGSSFAANVVVFDDPLPVPGASASSVPEPGTWSMMVFGLGAMATAMGFSRRRAAVRMRDRRRQVR